MKKILLTIVKLAFCMQAFAQVSINSDNATPDPSAMLDVKSSSMGMLVPRMTAIEREAISSPATGLLIFCTDNNQFYTNKGTPAAPNWVMMSSQWVSSGSDIYFTGGKIGLGLTNPFYPVDVSGDLNYSGTLRNNGVPVVTGVSGVTASLPMTSSGGANPDISLPQANSFTSGYLTWADWITFYNKQNSLSLGNVTSGDMSITGGSSAVIGSGMNMSINKANLSSTDLTISGGTGAVLGSGTILTVKKGNLTETSSSVLTINSGSNAVLGTGTTIQVKQANSGQSGYLTSGDWNLFNTKISGVLATLPLSSTGTIQPVISISQSGNGANGYLSSTDWTTFNNKQNALTFGNVTSPDITVTGGTGSVIGSGVDLSVIKGNLTETSSAVLNITGGNGAVLGTGSAIEVKQANTGQSGYLSSIDWNTFNDKVSSQWTTNGADIYYNSGDVGIGTTSPSNAASLEVTSTTKGFLPPRMTTTQILAISSPPEGLTIYDVSLKSLCFFDGTKWVPSNNGKSCGEVFHGGKFYATVIIGLQCWFKQDLNVGTKILGSANQANNGIIEKYCLNDLESNCDIYGGYYQWNEMMNYTPSSSSNPSGRQGICPTGWHIPSDAEWCQLETFLDPSIDCNAFGWRGSGNPGGQMKETGTSYWNSPNIGANNNSGFNGRGSGYRVPTPSYFSGTLGYSDYHSTTESSPLNIIMRNLGYDYTSISRNNLYDKNHGFSVRCVKD